MSAESGERGGNDMAGHVANTSGRVRRGLLAVATSAMVLVGLPLLASAPAGAVPAVDGNLDLAAGCGLDVTWCSTTRPDQQHRGQRRHAAPAVRRRARAPSQLKTVVFDTRAQRGADGPLTSTSAAWSSAISTAPRERQGGTNWDDGLEVTAQHRWPRRPRGVHHRRRPPTATRPRRPRQRRQPRHQRRRRHRRRANLANPVAEAAAIRPAAPPVRHRRGLTQGSTSEQRLNDVTGDEELALGGGGPPFGEATARSPER